MITCTVSDFHCEMCIVCSVLTLITSVFTSVCLPLTMCTSDAWVNYAVSKKWRTNDVIRQNWFKILFQVREISSVTEKITTHPINGEQECKFRKNLRFCREARDYTEVWRFTFFSPQNDLKLTELLSSWRVRIFYAANNVICLWSLKYA